MTVLLIAQCLSGTLSDQTSQALTAALVVGNEVDVLVAGKDVQAAAQDAARLRGVRKVRVADSDQLTGLLAEPLAALIVSLAPEYDAIVAPATSDGKNVMPRVAALLDVAQVSEVIEVVSPDTFKRTVYAGNVIQTVQSVDNKKVVTVRTAAFHATPSDGTAAIEAISVGVDPKLSAYVSAEYSVSDRPDLTSAKIVISGGRAMSSRENFTTFIEPVADKLGAALGASRAAVDAGYAPNDWQVGQTGKVVAPDLYIAVGISGAIQHLAGMKDSKVIVAINKDPDAPIFQVADYGIVGDLFEVMPALQGAL